MKVLITTVGFNPILSIYTYANNIKIGFEKVIFVTTKETNKYLDVLKKYIDIESDSILVHRSDFKKIEIEISKLADSLKLDEVYIDYFGATKAISIAIDEYFTNRKDTLSFKGISYSIIENLVNIFVDLNNIRFEYEECFHIENEIHVYNRLFFEKENVGIEIEKLMINKEGIHVYKKIKSKYEMFKYIYMVLEIFGNKINICYEPVEKLLKNESQNLNINEKNIYDKSSVDRLRFDLYRKTLKEFNEIGG